MSNPANNPLFKHFRQPAIYIKLPSNGKFYPDNAIDFPAIGEIPVYPMTVKDELTLKTPDALANGTSMAEVVASCCPNIKDPWQIPVVDLDTLFIAIRLASYGEQMDLDSKCPHCGESNEHAIDLRVLLDNVKKVDYDTPAIIDGLTIKFKPQTYFDVNQANIISFEEQRLVNSILINEELSEEEKAKLFKASLEKLNSLNINSLIVCIKSITTEDGTEVSNDKLLSEFLTNCSREVYAAIKEKIQQLSDANKGDPVNLACNECGKPYTSKLMFDQSNFFA